MLRRATLKGTDLRIAARCEGTVAVTLRIDGQSLSAQDPCEHGRGQARLRLAAKTAVRAGEREGLELPIVLKDSRGTAATDIPFRRPGRTVRPAASKPKVSRVSARAANVDVSEGYWAGPQAACVENVNNSHLHQVYARASHFGHQFGEVMFLRAGIGTYHPDRDLGYQFVPLDWRRHEAGHDEASPIWAYYFTTQRPGVTTQATIEVQGGDFALVPLADKGRAVCVWNAGPV